MARQTTIISIFLASPSDVSPERKVVERAIQRWNAVRGRAQGYQLELLSWELSTSSAIGHDGQDVVNNQIGNDYDAMIAIFWSRLGSKTPRADSGTVEEYERALDRHKHGEPIEVGVYFKSADPPMAQLDTTQLQGVFDLRKRMQDDGVYHKSFNDEEALSFEVELFLDRLVRSHQNATPQTGELITQTKVDGKLAVSNVVKDHDEPGLLDLLESIEGHSDEMVDFLSRTSERINVINDSVTSATSKFYELSSMGSSDTSEVKKAIDGVTVSFDNFSNIVEDGIKQFSINMSGLASDSLSLIRVSADFDRSDNDIDAARGNLLGLLANMDGAMSSMTDFAESVGSLQRMTVAFNRARRRLKTNVEELVNIMASSRSIIEEALNSLPDSDLQSRVKMH